MKPWDSSFGSSDDSDDEGWIENIDTNFENITETKRLYDNTNSDLKSLEGLLPSISDAFRRGKIYFPDRGDYGKKLEIETLRQMFPHTPDFPVERLAKIMPTACCGCQASAKRGSLGVPTKGVEMIKVRSAGSSIHIACGNSALASTPKLEYSPLSPEELTKKDTVLRLRVSEAEVSSGTVECPVCCRSVKIGGPLDSE